MQAALARVVRTATLVFLLVLAVGVFPAQSSAGVRLSAEDDLEYAVTVRINTVRASKGLRKLVVRSALKTAATRHVTNMALNGYFRHSWSNGTPFGTWIGWFWPGPGYSSWSAGENLYWREVDATARQVVSAWMGSSGHRANILRSSWTAIGVGSVHAVDPIGAYGSVASATLVAAEFGRRS
jgi:uncharacterized protein YkwD